MTIFNQQRLVDFFTRAYWSKAPEYLQTYVFVDLQWLTPLYTFNQFFIFNSIASKFPIYCETFLYLVPYIMTYCSIILLLYIVQCNNIFRRNRLCSAKTPGAKRKFLVNIIHIQSLNIFNEKYVCFLLPYWSYFFSAHLMLFLDMYC